ncbi:ATP phosphoribosyltransferase [bioreactor metagenome]|uniref:ATP phosphoribosyltransferase n=2 Tax=root TaxID=1 RepID=A0A645FLT1_9ZZZZ
MADCILDIVQTGNTLQANKLVILQEVRDVSLRLVASKQSASLKWPQIAALLKKIENLKGVVGNAN